MRQLMIILTVLVSANLFAQDTITTSSEHDNIESLDYSKSKEDLKKHEDKTVQEKLIESTNPRLTNPFGININIGGPSILLSFSSDYFITPNLNIEVGLGFIGLFGGIKYHLNGKKDDKNWTPYLGLYAVHIPKIEFITTTPARNGLYIPIGIQYMSNKGYIVGAEIAGITISDIANGTPVWGAIKLGYHFSK